MNERLDLHVLGDGASYIQYLVEGQLAGKDHSLCPKCHVCQGAFGTDDPRLGGHVYLHIWQYPFHLGKNAKVGGPRGGEIAVIGADVTVEENAEIAPGAMIDPQ